MAKKKAAQAASPLKVDDEWEARHGFETLLRAAEISANGPLMKKIKAHAKQHKERADRVSRLEGKIL